MPGKKAGDSVIRSTVKGDTGTITLAKSLYSLDTLYGTAFVFLDRCWIHLDQEGDYISVELAKRPGVVIDLNILIGEFQNELINQAVRIKLAKETEKVRTMIVGRAIGQAIPEENHAPAPRDVPELPPEVAKLLAEEEDSLDFLDDPLGIAVPWEEKYGKKEGAKDDNEGK